MVVETVRQILQDQNTAIIVFGSTQKFGLASMSLLSSSAPTSLELVFDEITRSGIML